MISNLSLAAGVAKFVASLQFYSSRELGRIFAQVQAMATTIRLAMRSLPAAAGVAPNPGEPRLLCDVCQQPIPVPVTLSWSGALVTLSCGHNFCYSCAASAFCEDRHCPICRKETSLDLDQVLDEFAVNFVEQRGAGELGVECAASATATGAPPCWSAGPRRALRASARDERREDAHRNTASCVCDGTWNQMGEEGWGWGCVSVCVVRCVCADALLFRDTSTKQSRNISARLENEISQYLCVRVPLCIQLYVWESVILHSLKYHPQ